MTIYDLEKQATPRPWGHASGVVTCADDGEHIGSFNTNTLTKSTPGMHRMNGPASAALAAHCRNHFMEALAALKRAKPRCDPNCLYSDDCDYALCQKIKDGFVCRAAMELNDLIAKLEEVK